MFKNVCFLDTETTSLNPKTGQVIELFIAKFDSEGVRTDHMFRMLFDEDSADKKALEINKYYERKELWYSARPFEDYAHIIMDVLMGSTIIAHNVSFDASFLKEEFARCGILKTPWKRPIDTYSIAKFMLENSALYSCSLKSLRYFFNLPKSSHHTAKDDVEDMIKIVKHLQSYRDSKLKRLKYKMSFFVRSKKISC